MNSVTETVRSWWSNEESSYKEITAEAKQQLEDAIEDETCARTALQNACDGLSCWMVAYLDAGRPEAEGMWSELLDDTYAAIDTDALAKEYIQDEPVYVVVAAGEDAALFVDVDLAREHLIEKLTADDDSDTSEMIDELVPGDTIAIYGKTWELTEVRYEH